MIEKPRHYRQILKIHSGWEYDAVLGEKTATVDFVPHIASHRYIHKRLGKNLFPAVNTLLVHKNVIHTGRFLAFLFTVIAIIALHYIAIKSDRRTVQPRNIAGRYKIVGVNKHYIFSAGKLNSLVAGDSLSGVLLREKLYKIVFFGILLDNGERAVLRPVIDNNYFITAVAILINERIKTAAQIFFHIIDRHNYADIAL